MTNPSGNERGGENIIAYIAGLVASDGHLRKNESRIEISSKNRKFLLKVLRKLGRVGIKAKIYERKNIYALYIYNDLVYDTLTRKFLLPPGKKAEKLAPIKGLSKKEVISFIRGFCDGDSTIHKRRMRNKYVPRIRIMSVAKEFIEWVYEELKKLGISCSKVFKDKPHGFGNKICWRIEIYGNNVKKFSKIIGYSHPEKKAKLRVLLKLLHAS